MIEYLLSDDTWDSEELDAINRVIKSRRFSMGNEVKEFEKNFARKIGSKFAVMSNSGSSANLLAVAALIYSGRLSKYDEVIVPAVSWSTTYFPLIQFNLKLKFIDIDKDTLNIDAGLLEEAVSENTKAVFAVNLLGNACNYDKITAICKKYNLILIEDNCEGLGGKFNGRNLGTFGTLGTFSTFYSHHICTMEGGITVTDDEELFHYMLAIRAHGWTRNLPENSGIYKKHTDDFYESFNFIVPGFNLRPLEMEGAVGTEQLKKLDGIILRRIKNAEYFIESVKHLKNIRVQKESGVSSWFGFAMVLEGNNFGKRKKITDAFKKNNIEVRPIVAGNFTRNQAVKYMDYSIHGILKNADDIHDNGFFTGNHSKDIRQNIDLLTSVLSKEFN